MQHIKWLNKGISDCFIPLYQWWVVPLNGQTLVGDHRTSSVLLSHQVCSQSSPAKPNNLKKNKGKKKKRWSRDRIIAFFGPKKHSLFNSVKRSMKSVLEWFLNEPSVLTLILASSGPLLVSDTLVPCFSLCLYVFITPQRKALLFWKINNLNGIKQ